MRPLAVALFVLFFASAGSLAPAQQPTPSPLDELLANWNYVGKKLVDMAEDFPEEKYGYRPSPEVRSFAQFMLHTAGANYLLLRASRGEALGAEDLPAEKYQTKAEIAPVVKKSFADCAAAIEQLGEAGLRQTLKHPFADATITQLGLWIMALENNGEHYGSLVVYYRLNGIVPPVSRRPH